MERQILVTFIVLFCSTIYIVNGKYVAGHMQTNSDWEFITRFCFLSDDGSLEFTFEYPITYAAQSILLYFDSADQWDSVYKTDKTCPEKIDVLNPANNQIINLTNSYSLSGCIIEQDENNVANYVCSGGRTFKSARERWWFIAVSRCYQNEVEGINLKYKIHMTNGEEGDYMHREYSADEFYIFPIVTVFLCIHILVTVVTIIFAVKLLHRQLLHLTYKLYMASVFLWTFYLFLNCIAYGVYGNDGLPDKLSSTKYAARAFEALSIMVFLLMLILIGKGYSITRGRLSNLSTVVITVFFCLYTITYVVLFIWEAIWFDPGLVLYIYESPPGYGLIALRLIGWLWFGYAIFFTVKHYPEKGAFYYPLFVFYTLWFWLGPIVIIIAMFSMSKWSREKTIIGVDCFIGLIGHLFFLILTRPTAFNKNFPYHVRTTQIGIMQNAPHDLSTGIPTANGIFSQQGLNYTVSTAIPMSNGPDLRGMFVTSGERSDSRPSSRGMKENGLTPDHREMQPSNGNVVPSGLPLVPSALAPSAPPISSPPPNYQQLFGSQST